jgi:hypothetical protein
MMTIPRHEEREVCLIPLCVAVAGDSTWSIYGMS